jgi:hypothetical protein
MIFNSIATEAELDNLAEDSDSIFEGDEGDKADEGISINCSSYPDSETVRLQSDGLDVTRREIYCTMKIENKSENNEEISKTIDNQDTHSHNDQNIEQ